MIKNRLSSTISAVLGCVTVLASCNGIPPEQEENISSYNYKSFGFYNIEVNGNTITDSYGKASKSDLDGTGGDTFYVLSAESAPVNISYSSTDGSEKAFPSTSIQTFGSGDDRKVYFTMEGIYSISDFDSVIWRVNESNKTTFLSNLKNDEENKRKYGLYAVATKPVSFIDSNGQTFEGGKTNSTVTIKRKTGGIGKKSFFYRITTKVAQNFDNMKEIPGNEITLSGDNNEETTYIITYRDEMNNEFHSTFTVDKLAPTIELASDGKKFDGGNTKNPVNIKWEDTDVKTATYSFNDGGEQELKSNTTLSEIGWYRITLTDTLNNTSQVEFRIEG